MSYANQVIKLDFTEELGSGPDDPIWVVIRNPKLLPPKMLQASKEAQAAAAAIKDGGASDADSETAVLGTQEMAGKLVVAWRVYDPAPVPDIDLLTGEVTGDGAQPLLPPPSGGNGVSGEQFAALPNLIQVGILREIAEAVNPQRGQEAPTSRTSSGSPSPSTTEPGAEAQ